MRLICVDITGFKRFSEASINLDEDVIAIVGPNEAGKSSLLESFISLENKDEYGRYDLSRGIIHPQDKTIVQALYLLDKQERIFAREHGGIGTPQWYYYHKSKKGTIYHRVEPRVERNKKPRKDAYERLNQILNNKRLKDVLDRDFYIEDDTPEKNEQKFNLKSILSSLKDTLDTNQENLSEEIIEEITLSIFGLGVCEEEISKGYKRTIEISREKLQTLRTSETARHPKNVLLDELDSRRPEFLFFGEKDRQLSGEYNIDVLNDPPAALKNLFDLAEIDITKLQSSFRNQDHASRASIQKRANACLREKFKDAWGQTPVSVHLQIDHEVIRILLDASDEISQIAERSDGLRAFVALYAFASLKSEGEKPILLIDEAETHLHYDAQADLIRVFENQDSVAKIIFTTHSAGCLPSDLGTGIRVINPILDDQKKNTGFSEIKNSFWTEGAGFSPLMLAMGASVLAFVPTRRALIAEGAGDMILLPSIFREVMKKERTGFQVAPGIAEVSHEEVGELDLEAPKVAYLVDGDEAGKKHKRKLISSGVSEDSIVQFQKGFTLEDFVDIDVLVEAINEELRRSNGDKYLITKDILGNQLRFQNIEKWCEEQGINVPSKTKVALHVVSKRKESSIVDPDRVEDLINVYENVYSVLFPE